MLSPEAIQYVVGFAFENDMRTPSMSRFILIEKKRGPANMKGKLNGIGGHIEANETPIQAIVREFEEETSVVTAESDWLYYHHETFAPEHTKNGHWATVHFLTSLLDCKLFRTARTVTDEKVVLESWELLYMKRKMANLEYLIPMAWVHLQNVDSRCYHGAIAP